LKVFVIIIP
jgi:hypothetical protein